MESLDYRYHTICINKGLAFYKDDGSVEVIVSHKDTGHKNWLDTCGHYEGTMCWRWYRLEEGSKAIEPVCEIVSLASLSVT